MKPDDAWIRKALPKFGSDTDQMQAALQATLSTLPQIDRYKVSDQISALIDGDDTYAKVVGVCAAVGFARAIEAMAQATLERIDGGAA